MPTINAATFLQNLGDGSNNFTDYKIEGDVLFPSVALRANTPYTFKSCVFNGVVTLRGVPSNPQLNFNKCQFIGSTNSDNCFEITGGNYQLAIYQCSFVKQVSLSNSGLSLDVQGGEFKKDVNISACQFTRGIQFIGYNNSNTIEPIKIKGKLSFISCYTFPSIRFCDIVAESTIEFNGIGNGGAISPNQPILKFEKGNYNGLNFFNNISFSKIEIIGTDNTYNVQIGDFSFSKKTIGAGNSVLIMNTQIKNADFSNYNYILDTTGGLKFQNVKFTGGIIWSDSDLGKTKFHDVDFIDSKITFDNSYTVKNRLIQ